MSDFAFHPELFESRGLAIETLAQHGYQWLDHFSAVDLLHDRFGLEVCGIAEEPDAEKILSILKELFPDWWYTDLYYHDAERDRGWKALIFKKQERRRRFTGG